MFRAETYSGPIKYKNILTILNINILTIFAKSEILNVRLGSEYVSDWEHTFIHTVGLLSQQK